MGKGCRRATLFTVILLAACQRDHTPVTGPSLGLWPGDCVPLPTLTDGFGKLNPVAIQLVQTSRSSQTTGLDDDCGPVTEDPFPLASGIWIQGWDESSCANTLWDPDIDGVHNGCENAVAAAFAPAMVFTRWCDWDYALARMGGEYYFAVRRLGSADQLRVAYLPAYYVDCGSPAWPPFGSGSGDHPGDSEFMIIDITFDPGTRHWNTDAVFLSSHCGEPTGQDCRWWAPINFSWVDDRDRGAPVVWVAEGKKANYYSQDRCNSGPYIWVPLVGIVGLGQDSCAQANEYRRFPAQYTQQNIGSRHAPLRDCAVAFSGSPLVHGVLECMWSETGSQVPDEFRGWQIAGSDGATPYGSILLDYAGF